MHGGQERERECDIKRKRAKVEGGRGEIIGGEEEEVRSAGLPRH